MNQLTNEEVLDRREEIRPLITFIKKRNWGECFIKSAGMLTTVLEGTKWKKKEEVKVISVKIK